MNIEHKKTTLNDDSVIYQKRDDSLGKKDTSNLTFLGKLGYFKDYYLKALLVIAALLAAAGYLIYSTTIGRTRSVFSMVFLNSSYIYDLEGIDQAITDTLSIEDKRDYAAVSNYDLEQYQENIAYMTQMSAGTIDLVVCPEDYFQTGCGNRTFADLGTFLPEEMYEALKDRIIEGSAAVTNDQGEVLSYEDPCPYGIDISGSARYKEFGGKEAKPILCVLANCSNTENTLKIVSWFTDVPLPPSSEAAVPAE